MEWSEQDVLSEQALAPRMLHVLNGDATREKMERSEVPGTLAVWADVLHEGPVPADLDDDHLREVRARFGASRGWGSYDEVLADLSGWDAKLASFAEYEEVVLWFEHDLFDQLALIRHLDWFARRELGDTVLSLICIGEFNGVERFHGLGQLTPDQLATLLGTRERVTVQQIELARRAWKAFTSPDPTSIERVLERDTSALPFLAGALRRFLEEYPALRSGLPRTERQILELLSRGATSPIALFRAAQSLEERVFMGDWTFWSRLEELARGPHPAIELSAPLPRESLPEGTVTLTDTGRRVLAGLADCIALNGIDRWLGGVHLEGHTVPWRWNADEARLERATR